MSDPSSTIEALKSILPEASWPWVIPALRQDTLVWQALTDAEFRQRAMDIIGPHPQAWSPASLAFLALDQSLPSPGFTTNPALRRQALHVYQNVLRKGSKNANEAGITLAQAGLLAIALHEHRRITGNWNELPSDLRSINAGEAASIVNWRTPLAVLYGLAIDRPDLVNALSFPDSTPIFLSLVIHTILSNPYPPDERTQAFRLVVNRLPFHEAACFLHLLEERDRKEASHLAGYLLNRQPTIPLPRSIDSLPENLDYIAQLFQRAEMHDLAGQAQQAVVLQKLALQSFRQSQGSLIAQLAESTTLADGVQAGLSIWKASLEEEPRVYTPAKLILNLLDDHRFQDASQLLPSLDGEASQTFAALVAAFQTAQEGDLRRSRQAARRAVQSLSDQIGKDGVPCDLLVHLVRLLLELTMPYDAVQAARLALAYDPQDSAILAILADALRLGGESGEAMQVAHLATALNPENAQMRRTLAASQEAAGQWLVALVERRALLDRRFASAEDEIWPLPADWRALAQCALYAGDAQQSAEACQNALQLDPEDGLAQAMLGEALAALGDEEAAMERFRLATQQAPHQPGPWLILARALQRAGQTSKGIDTLRAAVQAVPQEAAVHLALAEAYLQEKAFSQALGTLQQAYDLVTSASPAKSAWQSKGHAMPGTISLAGEDPARYQEMPCRIALLLAMTLRQLGRLEQARPVLENAYQSHPSYPNLAYTYAQVLLELGEPQIALVPLFVAVNAEPVVPEPYLDYARTLLSVGNQPEEAVRILQFALDVFSRSATNVEPLPLGEHENGTTCVIPARPDARTFATFRALLAEAFEASGDPSSALPAYYKALDTCLADDPAWRARLTFGLGRVALLLSQPETALAALQEATRYNPRDARILQSLTSVYKVLQLPEEALKSARIALQIAPDDVQLLGWFAEQAMQLGASEEAITMLQRAVQLDLEQTGLLIRLAESLSRIGDVQAALVAYQQVLKATQPSPDHLHQAAYGLLELGDAQTAVACLERALQDLSSPDPILLSELATLYHRAGDAERALETINQAIHINPDDSRLYAFKADLLLLLDRPQASQACLEHALNLHPQDGLIHRRMVELLRSLGKLEAAQSHADCMLVAHASPSITPEILASLALSADLARALLLPDEAIAILQPGPSIQPPGSLDQPARKADMLSYYCISAELSLQGDAEVAAAEALTHAFELSPDHPRVLALQARLAHRRGDNATALITLQVAQETLTNFEPATCNLNAVAEAALELRRWDEALSLTGQAASHASQEPYTHLQVARVLVLRAEDQRFCQSLEAISNTPGPEALAADAWELFEKAMQSTLRCLPEAGRSSPPEQFQRWLARGKAIFRSDPHARQNLMNFPCNSGDRAAYIAAFAEIGDLDSISQIFKSCRQEVQGAALENGIDTTDGKEYGNKIHHLILAQYSLAIGLQGRREEDFKEALVAARAALSQQPNNPLYQALVSRLALNFDDEATAQHAIQAALAIWPDEPRWQAMAASLDLVAGDPASAVSHLEQAIVLEPKYLPHHLSLGEAYLQAGDFTRGIRSLENGLRLAPDQIEPHLALAQAYFNHGDLARAAANTEGAINSAPDRIEPLLLRAEIALQMDDPYQAKMQVEAALRLETDDPQALYLLACALGRMGEKDEALEVLEKAIPLSVEPLPLLLEQVNLLESSRGVEYALSTLQELAGRYPDEPTVLAPLAKALDGTGQSEAAIRAAQRALRSEGTNLKPAEQAQLHLLLGRLLRRSGQLDQAIHQLSEAVRLAPNALEAFLELGETQAERRQHLLALQTYQSAIHIAPRDPRPYYLAGLALKASRDYQGAENMLRRAAELAPDDLATHRQLAALVALNLVHNRHSIPMEA